MKPEQDSHSLMYSQCVEQLRLIRFPPPHQKRAEGSSACCQKSAHLAPKTISHFPSSLQLGSSLFRSHDIQKYNFGSGHHITPRRRRSWNFTKIWKEFFHVSSKGAIRTENRPKSLRLWISPLMIVCHGTESHYQVSRNIQRQNVRLYEYSHTLTYCIDI